MKSENSRWRDTTTHRRASIQKWSCHSPFGFEAASVRSAASPCYAPGFLVVPTFSSQIVTAELACRLRRGKALVKFVMSERNRDPSFSENKVD